jgi:signal transduction histidine kinase
VSIRGYTEMIHKGRLGPVNDEQKKGLGLALANIDRLIAMIDNLLAFARMDREATALKIRNFPIGAVVEEAAALLRERIEAKDLRLEQRIADPSLSVRADRDKILQVFVNLLSNAVKFNRDGGSIGVDVRPGKPGFVLVQVKDSGVGIAKEDLEKIFDRFYQVDDRESRTMDGTGIGLAIVRNILRSHGCVIQASSTKGEGTTFSFTLPLAGDGAIAADRTAPVEAPPVMPPVTPPVTPQVKEPAADESPRPRLRIIRRG